MSWSATKYVWRIKHPDARGREIVKGSVKLLGLAVAFEVPVSKIDSPPISLRQLHDLTGLQDRQMRTCRAVLKDLGELEWEGRDISVYRFPKMLGPLFSVAQSGNLCRSVRQSLPEKSAKIAAKIAVETGVNAGGVLSLDLHSTEVLSTTTTERNTEAADELVEEFLDWFLSEYPQHRNGVLYTINPVVAEPIVRELLRSRAVSRLRAMARRMWAERQDPWILASDYGLHVLKHRAIQLENAVVGDEGAQVPNERLTPFEQARRAGLK